MPLNLVGAAIVFGIIFGVVSFGILALKTLRIIEKKGVFTMSVSKWLFLAGCVVYFSWVIYLGIHHLAFTSYCSSW